MSDDVVIDSRDILYVIVSFVALAIALTLMVFNLVEISRQAADAAETHAAVCVYRDDLKRQASDGQAYLIAHPNGLPALGISAAQIEQSIAREQAAVAALSGLHCS